MTNGNPIERTTWVSIRLRRELITDEAWVPTRTGAIGLASETYKEVQDQRLEDIFERGR
jgi:hypothetical protein